MKKNVLVLFLIFIGNILYAQAPDYKVVFDLTSKDTADQKTVIRWINGITSSNPNAKLEVVLYGQSLDMVVKDRSVAASDIPKLTENKNVSFKVCAVAMKKHQIDKSMLLPGVEIVADGIYEIITKQREGWGYIKATK
jgi:intracellular sulfur oxidation DsrE/DsrF family protein